MLAPTSPTVSVKVSRMSDCTDATALSVTIGAMALRFSFVS